MLVVDDRCHVCVQDNGDHIILWGIFNASLTCFLNIVIIMQLFLLMIDMLH